MTLLKNLLKKTNSKLSSRKCWPSLESLPEVPELALILVNATRVADMLTLCGKQGVPYVIIFSSGFSETGGSGVAMQQKLADIAKEYNIGVIGPNCQGMISPPDNVYAGFGSIFNADYTAGSVSMVSQSGGFGFSVMNLSSLDGGLPFRQMVTTGNEIGVSTLDFIDYFIRDPHTDIIGAYIEGVKDARRILDVGDKALAAGFNDLADHLQSMYRNLEAKVAEKTSELQEKGERLQALYDMSTLITMIETPDAFFRIHEITAASPRIVACCIGGEDFALNCNMQPTGEALFYPKQHMIIAANAAGVMPLGFVDSVAGFGDWEKFRAMVRRSRDFGFLGAGCIHPGQVTIVNEEYKPSAAEVEYARKVIATRSCARAWSLAARTKPSSTT